VGSSARAGEHNGDKSSPRRGPIQKGTDRAIPRSQGALVDGITFEQTPNGKSFLPQIQTTINPDGVFDMTEEYGLAALFDLNENEEFEDYKKPAEIVEFLERSLEAGETAEMPPQLRLSSTALEAISTIKGTIEAYADEASHDFITGHLNINKDWDNYIHGLEQRGYLTLEAIWNTAWEEQNE